MTLRPCAALGTLTLLIACGGSTSGEPSEGTGGVPSVAGTGGSSSGGRIETTGGAEQGANAGAGSDGDVVCDPNAVHYGDVSTCKANFDEMLGVTTLKGTLTLGSYWTDSGGCVDVSTRALRCLERIDGDLKVYDFIHSIEDISHLREVTGDALLAQAHGLKSLTGLESLRTVGGTLELYSNIFDTVDLAVETVGKRLTLGGKLKSLSLPALTSTGDLWITNASTLETLSGLESLAEVSGELSIEQNRALIDLHGLSGLTHAGSVSVLGNCVLPTSEIDWLIEHLGKDHVDGEVRVEENGLDAASCGP